MSRQASGLMAWLLQRTTAIYLSFLALYLLLKFIFDAPADHAELVTWVAHPLVAMALMLGVPLVLAHAWVGIRDVLIDYVRITNLRVGLMTWFVFIIVASGLWFVKAIITAGTGG